MAKVVSLKKNNIQLRSTYIYIKSWGKFWYFCSVSRELFSKLCSMKNRFLFFWQEVGFQVKRSQGKNANPQLFKKKVLDMTFQNKYQIFSHFLLKMMTYKLVLNKFYHFAKECAKKQSAKGPSSQLNPDCRRLKQAHIIAYYLWQKR